jgi:integrase
MGPRPPEQGDLYFRRLRTRLNMPDLRLHDLRHHAARTALDAGVPMHKVQLMLGHSRVSTTVDIYGQTDDVTEATDAVGAGIAYR